MSADCFSFNKTLRWSGLVKVLSDMFQPAREGKKQASTGREWPFYYSVTTRDGNLSFGPLTSPQCNRLFRTFSAAQATSGAHTFRPKASIF